MLKIGVQSKGILPEGSSEKDLERLGEGFRKIRQAGFDCVDLNFDVFLKNYELYQGEANSFYNQSREELRAYFAHHRQGCLEAGLVFSQGHAPYPVWVNGREEQSCRMIHEVIPKCIEMAGFLGIPYLVIHPFKMQYIRSCGEERLRNVEFFKKLIPVAREYGVTLCLENLYEAIGGRIVEGVCANPEEAVWYIDTLNEAAGEERFGFCLDMGHLNLTRRKPYEMITALGRRLKILHLHENDGVGDLHQLPYTFGRSRAEGFDWAGALRGLGEIGYDGVLSFETFPCMNSFPDGVKAEALRMLGEIGRYFVGEIEKARQGVCRCG